MSSIHSTSIVEKTAKIGQGTQVWHFCHIDDNAVIGDNCVIGQNVYIGKGVKIGDRVKIQNNVSVYSGVTIGDGVFIGPSVVFTNVKKPNAMYKQEYQKTFVGDYAVLGANSTILPVMIGKKAMVGAGAVVTNNVPDYTTVIGVPAK